LGEPGISDLGLFLNPKRRSMSGARRDGSGWSPWEIVRETYGGFRADRGFDLAGSLAFTSILTAIPLLATFSLLLAAFFRENDEQILAIVNAVLPYQSARLTQNLRDFIAESTTISGVGLALLAIASIRLIFVVEGIFNAVWGAPRRRAWLARGILYAFALLALALILGGITWGLEALRGSAGVGSFVSAPLFGTLAPLFLKALFLTLLFRYMPNARVRLGSAATAGVLVASLLELLRLGFRLYVDALRQMNLITGSLALLLLVVVSLYFAWALILMGVELTHVLQTQAAIRAGRAGEGRAEKAIRMLLRMSSAEPAPLQDIETNPEAPAESVAILEALKKAELVAGDEASGYRLAVSGRELTVARVVDALIPDLYDLSRRRQDRVALVLEPLFAHLDSERRRLLNATLSELRER
jgi:YihY family inner membrane protein